MKPSTDRLNTDYVRPRILIRVGYFRVNFGSDGCFDTGSWPSIVALVLGAFKTLHMFDVKYS